MKLAFALYEGFLQVIWFLPKSTKKLQVLVVNNSKTDSDWTNFHFSIGENIYSSQYFNQYLF